MITKSAGPSLTQACCGCPVLGWCGRGGTGQAQELQGHTGQRGAISEQLVLDPDIAGGATEMRTRRRPSPPVFRTVEEKLEHVAAGRGVIVLPLSTAVFYTRPDIVHSYVIDIPPNQVCLAWDATRRSQLIGEFAAIAADHPPVASPAA